MYWMAGIATVGAAVTVIWTLLKPIFKKTKALLESLENFTRDWFGEEGTPGRDAVPGVMERLNRIDGELKHNGGSSMKDSLRRIEKKIAQIDARLEEGNTRFANIEKDIEDLQEK